MLHDFARIVPLIHIVVIVSQVLKVPRSYQRFLLQHQTPELYTSCSSWKQKSATYKIELSGMVKTSIKLS